jgi:hypothetical protein
VVLTDELSAIAAEAAAFAEPGEEVAAVLAAEPAVGERVYLCAFASGRGNRTWLALDGDGRPVEARARLRDAVSIAALCEVAEETAGGGRLEELRSELVALRLTEDPPGIDEAEDAALELESAVGVPPRIASPAYLDAVGAATRRLELALGTDGHSPFAAAMKEAVGAVESLTAEVESSYKWPLR